MLLFGTVCDGWLDRCIDGRMNDEGTDGRTVDGWAGARWVDGWMHGQKDAWTDGWMHAWMDVWSEGRDAVPRYVLAPNVQSFVGALVRQFLLQEYCNLWHPTVMKTSPANRHTDTHAHPCIYIYIYIHMQLYSHTHIYIHIYIYTFMCVYIYICVYVFSKTINRHRSEGNSGNWAKADGSSAREQTSLRNCNQMGNVGGLIVRLGFL